MESFVITVIDCADGQSARQTHAARRGGEDPGAACAGEASAPDAAYLQEDMTDQRFPVP